MYKDRLHIQNSTFYLRGTITTSHQATAINAAAAPPIIIPGLAVIRGRPPVLVLEDSVDASELCDAVASDFPVWVAVDPVAVVEGPAVMVTGIMP
jgi:hypothetical protein